MIWFHDLVTWRFHCIRRSVQPHRTYSNGSKPPAMTAARWTITKRNTILSRRPTVKDFTVAAMISSLNKLRLFSKRIKHIWHHQHHEVEHRIQSFLFLEYRVQEEWFFFDNNICSRYIPIWAISCLVSISPFLLNDWCLFMNLGLCSRDCRKFTVCPC